MSGEAVLTLPLEVESDVFTARQVGRDFSVALGLERLDAVRVATSLSEIGREVVQAGGGTMTFSVTPPDTITVLIVAAAGTPARSLPGGTGWAASLTAAARLLDDVVETVDPQGRRTVALSKKLGTHLNMTSDRIEGLRSQLQQHTTRSASDELRDQNRELIAALEEVRRQKADLEVDNQELAETNRGVLALYDELSTEL